MASNRDYSGAPATEIIALIERFGVGEDLARIADRAGVDERVLRRIRNLEYPVVGLNIVDKLLMAFGFGFSDVDLHIIPMGSVKQLPGAALQMVRDGYVDEEDFRAEDPAEIKCQVAELLALHAALAPVSEVMEAKRVKENARRRKARAALEPYLIVG